MIFETGVLYFGTPGSYNLAVYVCFDSRFLVYIFFAN